MEKNYAFEIEKVIKERFKEVKKNKENYCEETKHRLLNLVENTKNTKKIEYLYKHRYSVLNRDIFNPELSDAYATLFRKILFTEENSVLFKEWNNIFSTVFGNMPIINDNADITFINKIITSIYNTKNEAKLKVLMKLFLTPYRVEKQEMEFINLLLFNVTKIEDEHILKSLEIIVDNIYYITTNDILKDKKEMILECFIKSISKYNSEYLTELLKIYTNEERNINNKNLLDLFKIFSESDNKELISAYYSLMQDYNFIKTDNIIQNRCIILLKNIELGNFMKTRLITRIILEIIVLCDNDYIIDYLIEKLSHIKNTKSLELILLLTPLLNNYANVNEFIRVIDSLEDKNSNLTKKLVINIDNEE